MALPSKKTLEKYLVQLRKIEEHREAKANSNIVYYYKQLKKDLQEFLGVEYAKYAQDDSLTVAILQEKAQYARFLEEVEKRINDITPKVATEIRSAVKDTYKIAYDGIVDNVKKSNDKKQLHANLKGIRAVTPEVIKNVVDNSYMEDALKRNHKAFIYDIRQQIGIGLTQGDRMSTMAKRMSEQIDKDYRKSMLITRTEVHRVREAGHNDASVDIDNILKDGESDYRMVKIWRNMGDESVRPQVRRKTKKGWKTYKAKLGAPNHVKMEGQTVLADEEFDLGGGVKAKSPGQSGVAGHDCNCRCFVEYELMTDAEYYKATGKHFPETSVVKKLEKQEQSLLDEQQNLENEKAKLEKRQKNLESYEYKDIHGNIHTPADYDALDIKRQRDEINTKIKILSDDEIDAIFRRCGKNNISGISYELEHKMSLEMKQKYGMRYSKLQTFEGDSDALNAYIKQQMKLYRSDMQNILSMLDDFESQGKTYVKLSERLSEINGEKLKLDDRIKDIRQKLMEAKGINPDKIQKEIDDLIVKIGEMDKPVDLSELRARKVYGSLKGETILESDGSEKFYRKWMKDYEEAGKPSIGDFEKKYDAYKAFFDDLDKVQNTSKNKTELKKLQKLLKDKQDELEEVIKRYDLKPKTNIVSRTDSAKILNTLQNFADKNNHKYDSNITNLARKLGISDSEVKVKLSKALGEIIDECDIGMRIRVSNLEKVLNDVDGGFKNLFETGTGGGCTNFTSRGNGEKRVFGYSKAVPEGTDVGDRPVYGMMIPNLKTSQTKEMIEYINDGPGSWYGDGVTCVIKKNKVFNNASFTLGDSLDYSSTVCGSTFDKPQFNGAFYDFGDTIKSFVGDSKTANEKLINTFARSDKYMEVQIHGKENHSADIIEKVYFDQNAFDRAKRAGVISKLDSKKIPYEILK